MRLPSLSTIATAVKAIRWCLFLVLLTFSGLQIVALMHDPASKAMGHFIPAAVALGVAVRLFAAKRSQFNQAAAELERLAARNRKTAP